MFERPQKGERTLLVHQTTGGPADPEEQHEFRELARAAGGEVTNLVGASRSTPDPRFYIGRGKVEEIKEQVADSGVELVIFNHE